MKTLIFAFLTIFLVGCSSDDDGSNNTQDSFGNIVTDLPQGSWKITYFFEDDTDQTDAFGTFVFTFEANGNVAAMNDLLTETGTWEYQNSASSSDDDEKLILQFTGTPPFDELSEDWRIVSANASEIELLHNSGGDGSTDLLTFTKI